MTTHTTTTWRIPLWASVPIGLAIVAEATSNALRAYGLGTHLERFTVTAYGHDVSLAGAVLVCAAVAVSLSQTRAAWAFFSPGIPLRQRLVSGVAGALLLAVSVMAMASHILEAERFKVADEGSDRGRYDRALAAYNKAAGELSGLGPVRTMEVIKSAMASAPVSRAIFSRTKECVEVTREDSFDACRPILTLREEMAQAIRKRQLETDVPRLKAELDRQTRPEVASASEDQVAGIWPWLMGLGVVFIATFGAVIYAKVEKVTSIAEPKQRLRNDFRPNVEEIEEVSQPDEREIVMQTLKAYGKPVNNQRLAKGMRVSEGESSRRVTKLNGELWTFRDGKDKMIGLPEWRAN